jgi:transposase InsO family protein
VVAATWRPSSLCPAAKVPTGTTVAPAGTAWASVRGAAVAASASYGRRERPPFVSLVSALSPWIVSAGLICRQGCAYDNAVAESFFATLKKELVHRRSWPTRRELISEVFEFVEGFYNTTRRHSTLGYLSPAQFETMTTININKENG